MSALSRLLPWHLADAVKRRCRRWRAPDPAPLGPPIEQIAANLRRLQAWLDIYDRPDPLPGKATKVAAAQLAYDCVLADACRALDVPESLAETRGFEHEAERLRAQVALVDAGLVLKAPHTTG
ncbi:MAG TPA: hypothetical protein VFN80_09505 [Acidothermaceae bacterium]|nr:hypothetical protein [Acidothermaceae bacterium]